MSRAIREVIAHACKLSCLSAYSSPTQTATPLSMSDADVSSPEPSGDPSSSLKRPGGLSDGPNARSKSVTTAEGDDTFGVGTGLHDLG